MGDFIALSIVLMVVLWSVHVVLRRLMPKTSMRLQQRLADQLGKRGLAKLAQRLQPSAVKGGCGGCTGCGTTSAQSQSCTTPSDENTQPVQWRP